MAVFSGGMRICDLIKKHTNTLVHLCKVRLQRMMRRRREELPQMAPACFVGPRRGKVVYARDVVPQRQSNSAQLLCP